MSDFNIAMVTSNVAHELFFTICFVILNDEIFHLHMGVDFTPSKHVAALRFGLPA